MSKFGGELAKRVAVASVGIPIAVAAGYLGGYWLAGLLALLAALAAAEFCRMYRGTGIAAAPGVAALLAVAYVILAVGLPPSAYLVWVTVLTLGVTAVLILRAEPAGQPGLSAVVTAFGAVYAGGLLAFALWLRSLGGTGAGWSGTAVLFLPVAITWLGDSAAYSVGRAIGRHKLSPVISPKKTWEGAIAGLVATAAGAALYIELTRPLAPWSMSMWQVLLFGAVVSIAGQVGDLFESRFKRDCAVKDSSNLLPGHGGALDRVDSLLFVFPFAYAFLRIVGV
ncbi:MAG: phosphatidate cytidylyltransferase [Gemmatimonadales bacterium]|jgi:phosphatidate cytidylyltransferase